jgi:hypothetical protein
MPAPSTTTRVRTRGPRATIRTICADGAEHRFTIDIDGTVTNPHHDREDDAVIAALGGEPHPCARAETAYRAARTIHDSRAGRADDSAMRRTRPYRRSQQPCPAPAHCSTIPEHVHSVVHQTNVADIPELLHPTRILLGWMERNDPTRTLLAHAQILDPTQNVERWQAEFSVVEAHITAAFSTAARRLLGNQPDSILRLRRDGTTIQWLAAVNGHVTNRTATRLRAHVNHAHLAFTLAAARYQDPRKVAALLNGGVTSYLCTYVKANVTATQVHQVRARTGQSLAHLLDQGVTLYDALHAPIGDLP